MSTLEKKEWSNLGLEIHHTLALWAAGCAEHTLHLFEEEAPKDNRPRFAIESLRLWVKGELTMIKCREAAFAAHAAAREVDSPVAVAAARAAGQAVAAAHMWNHSPHAAEYAANAVSLSVPKDKAHEVRAEEREWQWEHLRQDLRPLGFPKGK